MPLNALATLGAAYMGYRGTKKTNLASAQQAAAAQQFSQESAQKQMDFQERMSSTAIQRRMADLKAGGLNPILAGQHDASSPSGASAQGQQPNVLQNKLQLAAQIASSAAQTKKIQAETRLIDNELNKSKTWSLIWQQFKDMAISSGNSINDVKEMGQKMQNHPDWNKPIWKRDLDNKLFGQDFWSKKK